MIDFFVQIVHGFKLEFIELLNGTLPTVFLTIVHSDKVLHILLNASLRNAIVFMLDCELAIRNAKLAIHHGIDTGGDPGGILRSR